MEVVLLKDITVIFGLSIGAHLLFSRLGISPIVAFFVAGILAGPHGLRLVEAVTEVETLAEIGVVLLLFTIGMEFSFKRLFELRRAVLLGGLIQVSLTSLATFAVCRLMHMPPGQSVFMGFLIALSSTAIVLRIMQERAEIDAPHGRITLGILLFQDLMIVPMVLFTPLLAGRPGSQLEGFPVLAAKAAGVIVLVYLGAKWMVPWLLYQITRSRSRELFLLCIVVICLGVAWLTSSIGLSLALGAFLAGLIISESEYVHEALGNMFPFRDLFASFFFVSVGLLLDAGLLLRQPLTLALLLLAVCAVKALTGGVATLMLGYPLRTAMLVGIALSQVGEFSFILSKSGVAHGLLPGVVYQQFLAVSVLTMAVTPFMISLSPRFADWALRLPLPGRLTTGPLREITAEGIPLKDHLIIVGFGINGKNIARAARITGIPYVIFEMNPETVRLERARGEPIHYGDATREAVLEHGRVADAKVLVVAIADAAATRAITAIARKLNPKLHVIARTRFLQEMQPLRDLGADEVIPEEFETSVEIFARVLKKYLIPRDEIASHIADIRADGYEMLRSLAEPPASFCDLKYHLPREELSSLRVSDESAAAHRTLAQLDIRKQYGVTVLALVRDGEVVSNPGGDVEIQPNDLVLVLGLPEKITLLMELFRARPKERLAL